MKKINYIIGILLLAVLMTSCSDTSHQKTVLYISAASSLKKPVTEWKERFEKTHTNIEIKTNFGASGVLINQIKNGAPADLMFSAQSLQRFVSEDDKIHIKKEGIIASNELVFVSGTKVGTPVDSIEDIPSDAKLGIGNPDLVPAGYYAKQALQNIDHKQFKTINSQNAVHLKGLVETGAVEYAIMYRTDALENKRINIIKNIPIDWYPAIQYPAYSITEKKAAKTFLKYVTSKEGQKILKKYNFRESVKN
jgi:molybdate transport system substrate-binding protein